MCGNAHVALIYSGFSINYIALGCNVDIKQTKIKGNEISFLIYHMAMCSCGAGFLTVMRPLI